MVSRPAAETSSGVAAELMPDTITTTLTIWVARAAPTLLMNGCNAKVTAALRLPSFQCPYSMQSVMKTSISNTTKAWPEKIISPAMPIQIMFIGAKKNNT